MTDRAKLEARIVKAALNRFREWKRLHPRLYREVIQGDYTYWQLGGGDPKLAAAMVKACDALDKVKR